MKLKSGRVAGGNPWDSYTSDTDDHSVYPTRHQLESQNHYRLFYIGDLEKMSTKTQSDACFRVRISRSRMRELTFRQTKNRYVWFKPKGSKCMTCLASDNVYYGSVKKHIY